MVVDFPRITETDFARNSLGDQQLRQRLRSAATGSIPVDRPDHAAGEILRAIETEKAEQYLEN